MHETLLDQVCKMHVTYDTAQARSEYDGHTYYFCSMACKEAFDENPEQYIEQEEALP